MVEGEEAPIMADSDKKEAGSSGGAENHDHEHDHDHDHDDDHDHDHDHDDDHDHEHEHDNEHDHEHHQKVVSSFRPEKPLPLKEQIERDKDDESLRKWKEDLLGSLEHHLDGEHTHPQVKFLSLRILVEERDPMVIPLDSSGAHHFVLKEKCRYRLEFEFEVRNELLLGFVYHNKVWRMGKQVHKRRTMLGAYGPQVAHYHFITQEEVTPSGMLARGHYTAKTLFLDDDGNVYLEYDYTFDIKKDWE